MTMLGKSLAILAASFAASAGSAATVDVVGGTFAFWNTQYTGFDRDDFDPNLDDGDEIFGELSWATRYGLYVANGIPQTLSFLGGARVTNIESGSYDRATDSLVLDTLEYGFNVDYPVFDDGIFDLVVDTAAGMVRGTYTGSDEQIDLLALNRLTVAERPDREVFQDLGYFFEAVITSEFSDALNDRQAALRGSADNLDFAGQRFAYVAIDAELANVPLPASIALFGLSLAGLGVAGRRRALRTV